MERWRSVLPNVPFYYLDDGTESTEASLAALAAHPRATRVDAGGFDVGTAAGRNMLVDAIARDGYAYTIMADEDFMVDERFDLRTLWGALHEAGADIVGINRCETYGQCRGHHALVRAEGRIFVLPNVTRWGAPPTPTGACVRTDLVQQIFLARTQSLVDSPWDDSLKNNDHYDMFLSAQANALKVYYCPGIQVSHEPLCQCTGKAAVSPQAAAMGAGCASRGKYLQTRGRRWETFVPYLAQKWNYSELWDEESKIIRPRKDGATVVRTPFSPARLAVSASVGGSRAAAALRHLAPMRVQAHAAAEALDGAKTLKKAEMLQVDRCRFRQTIGDGENSVSWSGLGTDSLCPYLSTLLHVDDASGVGGNQIAQAAETSAGVAVAPRITIVLLAHVTSDASNAHVGDLVEADHRDALSAVMYVQESARVLATELGDAAAAVAPAFLLDDAGGRVASERLADMHWECYHVLSSGDPGVAAEAARDVARACGKHASAGGSSEVILVVLPSPWVRVTGEAARGVRTFGAADGFAYAPVAPSWAVGLLAAPVEDVVAVLAGAGKGANTKDVRKSGLGGLLAPAARALAQSGWVLLRDRPADGLKDLVRSPGLSHAELAAAALSEHISLPLDGVLGHAVAQAVARVAPGAAMRSLSVVRVLDDTSGGKPVATETLVAELFGVGGRAARLARLQHPVGDRLVELK